LTSAFHYRDGHLHCEDVRADVLAAEYGTPLYVYSQAAITDRYRAFDEAFAPLDRLIAYSVKANGNLSVLRLLAELGAGADIVSGGELHRALLAGIPGSRIVFSGVGKTVGEMVQALEAGVYGFNVESEGELHTLSEVAAARGVRAPVAIRVNPDIEAATPHHYTRTGHMATKFGVPYVDAPRLYRDAASLPGIELRGVDVHIGSQILEPTPYVAAIERVLGLVSTLRSDGIELAWIDVGGGFGVAYEEEGEPAPSAFAEALIPALRESGLQVVFGPGRYIVGPAGVLLARVLYVKKMGPKTFVITDAGMNDLLRPSHYASYHRIDPVERHPARGGIEVDVVGPVCESGDFLALDRVIERPEPGELIAIGTAGAYGFTMASTYNSRPRPAELLVDGTRVLLARRRERNEDLIRGELESTEAWREAPDECAIES
jgi:diaminopimelate decarboxylase